MEAAAAVHDPLPLKLRRRLAFGIAAGVLVGGVALAILVNDEADDAVTGEAADAPPGKEANDPSRAATGASADTGPRALSGAARVAAAAGARRRGVTPLAAGDFGPPAPGGAAPHPDGGAPAEPAAAGAKVAQSARKTDGGVAPASAGGTAAAATVAGAAAATAGKAAATAARGGGQEGWSPGGLPGSGAPTDGGVRPGDGGVPDAAPAKHGSARAAVAAGEGGKPSGGGGARSGGAWVNERSRGDEEDSLTRIDRFVAGGSTLKGHVIAAETGKPLEGATIHAHSGGAYVEAYSDAAGVFRVAGMPPKSRAIVWVDHPGGAFISERIEIELGAEGQSADVGTIRLLRGDELRERAPGWVGLFVSRRGAQLIAGAVSAWLPADTADIQVGDELLSIDGHDTAGLGPRAATYLLRGTVGVPATLVVRSHGNKRTLKLDRVPR